MDQKPLFVSSATPQRTAYSEIPSQMAAHVRFAVHCRLGRRPDSNPGLQVYSLALLPISHYCSQIKDLFQKLNILLFSFHMILNNSLTLCCHTVLSWTLCVQHKPKVPVSISWGYHAPGTAVEELLATLFCTHDLLLLMPKGWCLFCANKTHIYGCSGCISGLHEWS